MIRFPRFPVFGEFAVDPGSANTLVYQRGKGVVLAEPTIVTCRREMGFVDSGKPLLFGSVAKLMADRLPPDMAAVRPIRRGIVADPDCASSMLRRYFGEISSGTPFRLRSRAVVCVPSTGSARPRRALGDAVRAAGARRIQVVKKTLAAAIGAGLPIREAAVSAILDIGAETCEIGVFSRGGIVHAESIDLGSQALDAAIIRHVEATRGLVISPPTAETIKCAIADPCFGPGYQEVRVAGRNRESGLLQILTIGADEIAVALWEPIDQIASLVRGTVASVSGALRDGLLARGIVLSGGGALLRNLCRMIGEESDLPCRLAEDPLTCAVCGAGAMLERHREFRHLLEDVAP